MTRPLVCLIALCLLGFAPASQAAAPTDVEALAQLNAWRAEIGIPGFVALDPTQSEGCALHNRYMDLNDTITHGEVPGRPGYTAEGALAGPTSVLAQGIEAGPREVWAGAIYHRMALLAPRLATSGYAAGEGYSCMGVGGTSFDARTPQLSVYPYPYDGQQDVPLRFTDNESPDPADDAGGDQDLGYLISANVNGPWRGSSQTTLAAVSLTAADGSSVPVVGVDQRSPNGWALRGGFAVFPTEALRPDTTYTARAVGTVSAEGFDYPLEHTWSFSTGVERKPRSLNITVTNRRKIDLTGTPGPATVTIARGQRVVATRAMSVPGSWRVPVKRRARYHVCVDSEPTREHEALHSCMYTGLGGQLRIRHTSHRPGR